MQIVLPGALPTSAPIAAELAKRLPTAAPTLYAWMRQGAGRQTAFDPHEHGCTPFEAWQLEQAGFRPSPGQPIGAGLGPLRAGGPVPPDEKIWIADLAHIVLGTDRASLLPADALGLSADEGAALFEAAHPLFAGTPFDATMLAPYRWRVQVPQDMALPTASPDAVTGQPLDSWWSQDAAARPWRRLMNEIQMVWHDHPVNAGRAAQGLLPVNGLWLYGGAAPWPSASSAQGGAKVADGLLAAFQAEDWAAWLHMIERLDNDVFKPCADARGRPIQPVTLTLLGRDRRATLALRRRGPLLRWLPAREQPWRTWWSPPV
jgi:hypothetical protein